MQSVSAYRVSNTPAPGGLFPGLIRELIPELLPGLISELLSGFIPELLSGLISELLRGLISKLLSELIRGLISQLLPELIRELISELLSGLIRELIPELLSELMGELLPGWVVGQPICLQVGDLVFWCVHATRVRLRNASLTRSIMFVVRIRMRWPAGKWKQARQSSVSDSSLTASSSCRGRHFATTSASRFRACSIVAASKTVRSASRSACRTPFKPAPQENPEYLSPARLTPGVGRREPDDVTLPCGHAPTLNPLILTRPLIAGIDNHVRVRLSQPPVAPPCQVLIQPLRRPRHVQRTTPPDAVAWLDFSARLPASAIRAFLGEKRDTSPILMNPKPVNVVPETRKRLSGVREHEAGSFGDAAYPNPPRGNRHFRSPTGRSRRPLAATSICHAGGRRAEPALREQYRQSRR